MVVVLCCIFKIIFSHFVSVCLVVVVHVFAWCLLCRCLSCGCCVGERKGGSCVGERNNGSCVGEKIVVVAQVEECCGCLGEGTVVVV